MTLFKKSLLSLTALIAGAVYWLYPDRYPIYPESDHYSSQTGTFFNLIPEGEIDGSKMRSALWDMVFNAERFAPKSPLPSIKPDFEQFLTSDEQAKFIWFGHSSLLAHISGKTIFIDPVFAQYASPVPIMMKRFQPAPAKLEDIPPVDVIILSHNHYDHLDKSVIEHYRSQKTRFIVPLGVGVILQKWGIEPERIQELDWWQSTQLDGIQISAVAARHNTGRELFDRNKTLWVGYVFKTASEQFYYSGDTSFGDGSQFGQIAERFGEFDLAFVENGQYNPTWIDSHMLPEQTAQAVSLLKAKRFMPVHWGAYPLSIHEWDDPVKRSIPLVEQQGIKTVTPLLGEIFTKKSETEHWWKDVK